MPKRIVICFDGTWNTPGENFQGLSKLHARFAGLRNRGQDAMRAAIEAVDTGNLVETNVCRLYRSVRRSSQPVDGFTQVKWYDGGVGTEWFNRIRGGALGMGLSTNIREGYKFLSDTYAAGDQIFIFGFSRGAYTARSLVGMIRNCGLLPADASGRSADSDPMLEAYALYRNRTENADSPAALAFRQKHGAATNVTVKCLGVWDTVGALGIPIEAAADFNKQAFAFHDTELSGIVEHAFHALAVDEHRAPYDATLWSPKQKPNQTIEQRWFAGAHCDVGGGYEDRRLSDIPLKWMQDRAAACGLVLDPTGIPKVGPGNIEGKLSDSFGAFLGGVFALFQQRHYRRIGATDHGRETIDKSVFDRIAAIEDYRPANKTIDRALIGG